MAAWRLGARLTALRQEAGLTRERAAALVGLSLATMERTESGLREVDSGEVWKIQQAYGFSTKTLDELVTLAKATTAEAAWFDHRDDLPEGFSLYGELEASAVQISAYEPRVIFGLLQTPEYARAAIESAAQLTPAEVDKRLTFRLSRQKAVLRHPAPKVRVVLAVSALKTAMGSTGIVRQQLKYLQTLAATEAHLDIRVRPENAEYHPALGGPFIQLQFPKDNGAALPDMTYVETYLGAKYIEESDKVREMSGLFEAVLSESIPIEEYL